MGKQNAPSPRHVRRGLRLSSRVVLQQAPPAGVAAAVNGRPITDQQLEKTYKTQYGQQPENANADLVKSQKLELLGSLITNQIMLLEAEKLGLQAVDADVEAEITKMKRLTPRRSSTSSSPAAT